MLPAEEGGYVSRQVAVEVETLRTFKARVDGLLSDLDGSPASEKHISGQYLAGSHLGTGFAEASDLHAAYTTVHTNLRQLSGALAQQIEAMSITVDASMRGYSNVDEEQRRTLWRIRDATEAAYRPPAGADAGTTGTPSSTAPSPAATRGAF